MANQFEFIEMTKPNEDCKCRLETRVVLQRNDRPLEKESQLEPTDDAVYKIVVTNLGPDYAKDVKALTWLEVTPTDEGRINLPHNLRIIPHGLLGRFKLENQQDTFPDDLVPVKHDLDFQEFIRNAQQHDIPLPLENIEEMRYWCNVIRFGDIPAGQTKVSCLTIISEGAPEKTKYRINLFFKFEGCKLVEIAIPIYHQVEYCSIYGSIAEED